MATAGAEFTKIFTYNGSSFTDVTLEAQSPAGTVFSILGGTNHFLYLGHDSKFDMAIFDLETAGNLGSVKWEYYNGSAWTEFVPASGRYELDPDDNEGGPYEFARDGAEIFPYNLVNGWATTAVNSITKYWIRASSPTSVTTAPTVKRIQMRAYTAYCTTKDVFELLQLGNITSTTDFTTTTTPSQGTVEQFILEAQSVIDFQTRKSWRPAYTQTEYHQFNLNGFQLDRPDPYKILRLQVWNGATWDDRTQGRSKDYFLVPDTGLVHFSRYFLLPARFTSYNAPVWRWGGGEFTMPVKVTYLSGRDINTDYRQGGIVQDLAKKLAAIDIVRSSDFGNLVVSGTDRVQLAQKIDGWQAEIEDRLDSLRSFEVFYCLNLYQLRLY